MNAKSVVFIRFPSSANATTASRRVRQPNSRQLRSIYQFSEPLVCITRDLYRRCSGENAGAREMLPGAHSIKISRKRGSGSLLPLRRQPHAALSKLVQFRLCVPIPYIGIRSTVDAIAHNCRIYSLVGLLWNTEVQYDSHKSEFMFSSPNCSAGDLFFIDAGEFANVWTIPGDSNDPEGIPRFGSGHDACGGGYENQPRRLSIGSQLV